MHVVLSTKFEEPWLTVSIGVKEILEEKGCTVYNPNVDNAEIFGDMADNRWLLTFNENLAKVKQTQGFVLQIQQGAQRERSHMQLAEEMQSAWLQVPRIGYFAFATRVNRGGSTAAEPVLEYAVTAAQRQWATGIRPDVEMVSQVFEPLDGAVLPLDVHGNVHGRVRCTWPDGTVYEGDFEKGASHGRGIFKYASGSVYEGEFREGQKHGPGIFKYAEGGDEDDFPEDGAVDVTLFENDGPKGPGVRLSADRQRAWLLRDGEEEHQLSISEAQQKVKELGLPELPP